MTNSHFEFTSRVWRWALCLVLTASVAIAQDDSDTVSTDVDTSSQVSLDFLDAGKVPTSIDQLRAMESKVAEVFEIVKPATVNIRIDGPQGSAQGSGIVVSRDGYILTAAHVINGPHHIATVTFPDGTDVKAKTLGINPIVDAGMLKIDDPKKKRWPYIELGESTTLNDGQWVVAIGHPGGIDRKRGLVLRVGRVIDNATRVLRTDCTLVGGDSGGPLVDMDGYLIGIHSRIGNSLNDNLHVPVDIYSENWDSFADAQILGREVSPYVGIDVVEDTNQVAAVAPGGPADEAGLKRDDVIIKIGDKKIENKSHISNILRKVKPKDKITIVVKRTDKESKSETEITLELTVGSKLSFSRNP